MTTIIEWMMDTTMHQLYHNPIELTDRADQVIEHNKFSYSICLSMKHWSSYCSIDKCYRNQWTIKNNNGIPIDIDPFLFSINSSIIKDDWCLNKQICLKKFQNYNYIDHFFTLAFILNRSILFGHKTYRTRDEPKQSVSF